jgi:hypothetical protein
LIYISVKVSIFSTYKKRKNILYLQYLDNNTIVKVSIFSTYKRRKKKILTIVTTRFHSFTDGNISSVCDYQFVGELFTDVFTDIIRLSAFLSSVIPHSVAISIGNIKKPFADGFTNEI